MSQIQEKIKQRQIQRKKLLSLDKSLLPAGTCSKQDFKKFNPQLLNTLLDSPMYYDLTISTQLCMCILVREITDQNKSQSLPIYHLYEEKTKKHLLSAQKQPNNIGSNYIISTSKNPKKNQVFIGKLRGNFRNNEFNIFDGGENPDKKINRKRKQLAFIRYQQPSLFGKKQSICQIILPKPEETPQSTYTYPKYHPQQFIPQTSSENLLEKQFSKLSVKVLGLVNESSLNSKSIKNLAESGNFGYNFIQGKENILIERQNKQQGLILLKRSQNTYYLKIESPFNLVQGMGFALAHLQNRLS